MYSRAAQETDSLASRQCSLCLLTHPFLSLHIYITTQRFSFLQSDSTASAVVHVTHVASLQPWCPDCGLQSSQSSQTRRVVEHSEACVAQTDKQLI
ncbi:UNVERIFIED_CONTAM: hypothetical protein FKN15_032768 [Acipenser sinensis]